MSGVDSPEAEDANQGALGLQGMHMLEAIVLLVGAFVAWVAADQLLVWLKSRREGGSAPWHGHGPGATFHSTGFEDTLPPHEAADRGGRLRSHRH